MSVQQKIEKKKSAVELWKRDFPGDWTAVDLNPEDHYLAIGFENSVVHLIDPDGNLVWEAEVGQSVRDIKILPGKKRVAILNEYSQLIVIDYAGKLKFKKGFKNFWSGVEVKSGDVLLWGWKNKPRRIDSKGRTVREYDIPSPWLRVIPVPKKEQFWVVHNQVCMGLYQSDGANLWLVNSPAPLELSRAFNSDFSISDRGDLFAVSCFHKGAYFYNGNNHTLSQIDLDRSVSHVDVSGNGKFILLSDQMGSIYMASSSAAVVWEKELLSPVGFCRIDHKGSRVIVGEENGTLSCFKFLKEGEKRTNFLELSQFHDLGDHKEIWSQPVYKVSRTPAALQISGDGRFILMGDGKEFQLYDMAGNLVWVKHFMTRLADFQIAADGKKIMLSSRTELFLLDTQSQREKHLTFYSAELKEVVMAPSGAAVLAFDKYKTLTCYNSQGGVKWSRTLKTDLHHLRIHHLAGRAVFQSTPKTLYVLELKTMKLKPVTLGGPVTALNLNAGGIFAGGEMGRCYGIDLNGRVQWKHQIEGPIQEIVPLKDRVVFRNRKGGILICGYDGKGKEHYSARHSQSRFAQYKKDILELVPSGDMLSCFKVPSGDLVWRLPLAGAAHSIAVSETGNRMAILDSQSMHYHQLVYEARAVEDRSSFLEL